MSSCNERNTTIAVGMSGRIVTPDAPILNTLDGQSSEVQEGEMK